MSSSPISKQLSEADIAQVRQQARQKLVEFSKLNDIIGVQIFAILGIEARVLYYPLGEDGPWGFTCQGTGKPFIALNTAIDVEKQVFAAAHELYHIFFNGKADFIPSSILGEIDEQGNTLEISELKANRFAAEFLVDESLLKQEMQLYSVISGKVTVKDILMLANLFYVPYEMMVKRLCEVNAITSEESDALRDRTLDEISNLRRRYSFPMPKPDNRIALDNLPELAVKQFEKGNITYEKFTYLLHICELTPADVGIDKPADYVRPSDDELDRIMEE